MTGISLMQQIKRLADWQGEIAKRLRGKHKPIYTPHVDTGDFYHRRQCGKGESNWK